jgi:polyhydroxyalkanoate synthesis repressor PhaR
MAARKQTTVIKKYANRRLYHTGTSAYVTLEDLAGMVREGEEFEVFDAKSGEDITRSVLAQIIFEEEAKEGQNLLPIPFLRQLIQFYGGQMQAIVPKYLEFTMDNLTREQAVLKEQMAKTFGETAANMMDAQVRTNMKLFQDAMKLFNPLSALTPGATAEPARQPAPQGAEEESPALGTLQEQMQRMQAQLDKLAKKG